MIMANCNKSRKNFATHIYWKVQHKFLYANMLSTQYGSTIIINHKTVLDHSHVHVYNFCKTHIIIAIIIIIIF